jgi:hypothetical protein
MADARRTGLIAILLSAAVFVLWGFAIEQRSTGAMTDFKGVYYGARCLLQHCDPYNAAELEGFYKRNGWEDPTDTVLRRQAKVLYVNLPTSFLFLAPFAALPFGPAHFLWMALIAACFLTAAMLMWKAGAAYSPGAAALMVSVALVNSEVFLAAGNTAGIVVSLCIIAAWCFIEGRYPSLGVLSLLIALTLKPHDAGFVWLYFLLAGGIGRRAAVKCGILAVALAAIAAAWVTLQAPHWTAEMRSNLAVIAAPGGLNSPSPKAFDGRIPDTIIDLQALVSMFRDDPQVYDTASYLACGILLVLWGAKTARAKFTKERAWLALAVIAPLTMLPTYHRQYDAKLLLLATPACALLWAGGGLTRWIALLLNLGAILLNGDTSLAIFYGLTKSWHPSATGFSGELLTALLTRPSPIVLLMLSLFYLWVYLHHAQRPVRPAQHDRRAGASSQNDAEESQTAAATASSQPQSQFGIA